MKKPTRNYKEEFGLRMPDGMRDNVKKVAAKKKYSMNDEFVHRIAMAEFVPDDITMACKEMGDVKDRFDFAVRVFQGAGFDVSIPAKKVKK